VPYGDGCAGSTTISAPQRDASVRRAAEKSLATMVWTPRALRIEMTTRPIGPHPIATNLDEGDPWQLML
jgi:hypothetical protein